MNLSVITINEHCKRLMYQQLVLGDLEKEIDGYYVFWPKKLRGFYSQELLESITRIIRELNLEWDCQVDRDLRRAEALK